MKVRVWLPVQITVPYIVESPDLNIENVKKALLAKGAGGWETDPNFYENLGSNFPYYVQKLSQSDMEMIVKPDIESEEETAAILRDKVVQQLREQLGREPTESEIQTFMQSVDEGMG